MKFSKAFVQIRAPILASAFVTCLTCHGIAFADEASGSKVVGSSQVSATSDRARISIAERPAMRRNDQSGAIEDRPAWAHPHVTVSRAADLVGNPVDIDNPIDLSGATKAAGLALSGTLSTKLPVAASILTSRFGLRYHPLLGFVRPHDGVDLAAPTGTPVHATSDGFVRKADWNGGYGLFVELDNGKGLQTRYGHLSRLNVVSGERIHKGDVVGYVGSTGLSTGPHVHYEVRINGTPVNPLAVGR